MMEKLPQSLRNDVRDLGALVGDVLKTHAGGAIFDRVEEVRSLAKRARSGDQLAAERLASTLGSLPVGEALPVASAFSMFLTLVNIAEAHHRLRDEQSPPEVSGSAPAKPSGLDAADAGDCDKLFATLLASGVSKDELHDTVARLEIELVLTAHPTQVVRRTLLQKYNAMAELLVRRDSSEKHWMYKEQDWKEELKREIISIWDSDEVNREKPTPLDEARGGLVMLEQVAWDALPVWLRGLDAALVRHTGRGLPPDAAPIRFGSWMGGDRDGNPNVTPDITRKATYLGRWMGAHLLYNEIDALRTELSSRSCNTELRERVGDVTEPYREVLRVARDRLLNTRLRMEALLEGRSPSDAPWYLRVGELREVLLLCYRSLCAIGQESIARGRLLDAIRRVECFGLTMTRLDIRQESDRHTEALAAITKHLDLGDYSEWDEEKRQEFLVSELTNKRPLIPNDLPTSASVADVLDTFRVAAEVGPEGLGAYVISMAHNASDVLAVELLQKAVGNLHPQRVAPLFETIDDLRSAGATMRALFNIPWYLRHIHGKQEIMVGYSDSAKDGSRLAANWELYRAQESVVAVCKEFGVHPTLFHGRGGTVARGGGPTHLAIQSQPAGSILGTLRVTEQGEMIQAKFGNPRMAMTTLDTYVAATVNATLAPPRTPVDSWRNRADKLAQMSCDSYRAIVHGEPRFVEYFRRATPEVELGALNIGSRPARRKSGGGIETLRAIPWIFAWTQNRLCVPSWLGTGAALKQAIDEGHLEELQEMYTQWPFFRSTIDLIEMVVAKADPEPSHAYDSGLVPPELHSLGQTLRNQLQTTIDSILQVSGHKELLENSAMTRLGLELRDRYMDPINVLQVELLRRIRATPDGTEPDAMLWEAFVVTVNGIAAGMRNTG